MNISAVSQTPFNDNTDLYEILDAQRNTLPNKVRQTYLKMSKKHYPKIQGGSSYDFQLHGRAYRVLNNQDKRNIYNMYNNIIQADNYESNNEGYIYLDGFSSLEAP